MGDSRSLGLIQCSIILENYTGRIAIVETCLYIRTRITQHNIEASATSKSYTMKEGEWRLLLCYSACLVRNDDARSCGSCKWMKVSSICGVTEGYDSSYTLNTCDSFTITHYTLHTPQWVRVRYQYLIQWHLTIDDQSNIIVCLRYNNHRRSP